MYYLHKSIKKTYCLPIELHSRYYVYITRVERFGPQLFLQLVWDANQTLAEYFDSFNPPDTISAPSSSTSILYEEWASIVT